MCGVLGLMLDQHSKYIGKYASNLLRALEYRGYDSTGALVQGDGKKIELLKDVGAPSTLVKTLGIENMEGKIFCGQVRWATFGKVDRTNAQPHIVECKTKIYGAHNGNITNTIELKKFLEDEGHKVLSDNDGEMLVHTVEHYFDIELNNLAKGQREDDLSRRKAMRKAITRACEKMIGSFAAVVVDPVTEVMYAIKAGSSLYFGIGEIRESDGDSEFCLASSDLTAVLRFTKNLVDLTEGEFVEYTSEEYKIFAFKDRTSKKSGGEMVRYKKGEEIVRRPFHSKLRAEDTELSPEYSYFMEQEIHAEAPSTKKLVKLFQGGSNSCKNAIKFLEENGFWQEIEGLTAVILKETKFKIQKELFDNYKNSDRGKELFERVSESYSELMQELNRGDFEKRFFFSSDKNIFIELADSQKHYDKLGLLVAKGMDSVAEKKDVEKFNILIDKFKQIFVDVIKNNSSIFVLACGSSYHAAKTGAQYFNEIAGVNIFTVLPGEFRGQHSKSLRSGDVLIGVSQSGETKDLIDIFDGVSISNPDIAKIVLVNNLNSTLGQEKSDLAIPLFCGPEMSVPATKSFINQLMIFYYLAIEVLRTKIDLVKESGVVSDELALLERSLSRREHSMEKIPQLIHETILMTSDAVQRVADMIYMVPSMQILATKMVGIAKEGALKIRETVLNHTEGGEASEFKHGPNTILGLNTTLGLNEVNQMFNSFVGVLNQINTRAEEMGIKVEDARNVSTAFTDYVFNRTVPFNLTKKGTELFNSIKDCSTIFDSLQSNYPLFYITGPEERDVNLTISQINTHKIRGADTFVIAEKNDVLKNNIDFDDDRGIYKSGYIELPKTGDTLLVTFSATVVLQLLSLFMSIKKMEYLNRLRIRKHGVHPDVPKNVSKSITVD